MPASHLITTAFELPGQRIEASLGIARGIVVRSRSIVGSFGAAIQTIFGGNISLYTSLCERARQEAYDKMLAQAAGLGANAIIGMRYDATEIGSGITEVLCYGTAVRVVPAAVG
ncbi:YbjQ family protein [Burkholderia gladioli]|uniref:YbjQ family protein n=1 Tax=Burkholderia gladioli TaxID=28095 RepID=UPI00163F554D|nr:YbjQ family protein [Burkholderia gladioli]